jgi:pimeloyl-ACP methyl ester carboxylesterase
VALSAGPVSVREAGDPAGPTVVFVHGYGVNGTLWDRVAAPLSARFRCVLPDLPFGSHPHALPNADLSPPGAARLLGELAEAIGTDEVTIVANDSGGAVTQIFLTERPPGAERVGRLVLTNCDCFEAFPPGVFKLLVKTLRAPGGIGMVAASLRSRAVQRSPLAYGSLSKDAIPDELLDSWVLPLRDAGVRDDARRFGGGMDPRYTLAAAAKLPSLEIPALLCWAERDRFFTIELGERLARTIPDAKLVRFRDSLTFVPLDEPEKLAKEIEAFVTETSPARVP